MTVSKKTKEQWAAHWNDPEWQMQIWEKVEAQRRVPFAYSQLRYWLGLEVWTKREGLLVLAGIEPGTVQTETDPSLFSEDPLEWTNAMPFAEDITFFQFPDPPNLTLQDHKGDVEAHELYLQEQERRGSVIGRHQRLHDSLEHKLGHSPSALGLPVQPPSEEHFPPVRFLSWAMSIDFKPDWFDWASENGLLPDHLQPMAAPFFDADSDEYPALLAIAVRAWVHAKAAIEGTPKQRVERFLAQKYRELTGSARRAIALVANWQKSGGRPRNKE